MEDKIKDLNVEILTIIRKMEQLRIGIQQLDELKNEKFKELVKLEQETATQPEDKVDA